jgi:hypothetical protein
VVGQSLVTRLRLMARFLVAIRWLVARRFLVARWCLAGRRRLDLVWAARWRGGCGQREADPDPEPTIRQRMRLYPGAVRLSDRGDDGQPQPQPVPASGAVSRDTALKRLEEPVALPAA